MSEVANACQMRAIMSACQVEWKARRHLALQSNDGGRALCSGLSSVEICARLQGSQGLPNLANDQKCQSAEISRILSCFHTHKLIASIRPPRRWRVTDLAAGHDRVAMPEGCCPSGTASRSRHTSICLPQERIRHDKEPLFYSLLCYHRGPEGSFDSQHDLMNNPH